MRDFFSKYSFVFLGRFVSAFFGLFQVREFIYKYPEKNTIIFFSVTALIGIILNIIDSPNYINLINPKNEIDSNVFTKRSTTNLFYTIFPIIFFAFFYNRSSLLFLVFFILGYSLNLDWYFVRTSRTRLWALKLVSTSLFSYSFTFLCSNTLDIHINFALSVFLPNFLWFVFYPKMVILSLKFSRSDLMVTSINALYGLRQLYHNIGMILVPFVENASAYKFILSFRFITSLTLFINPITEFAINHTKKIWYIIMMSLSSITPVILLPNQYFIQFFHFFVRTKNPQFENIFLMKILLILFAIEYPLLLLGRPKIKLLIFILVFLTLLVIVGFSLIQVQIISLFILTVNYAANIYYYRPLQKHRDFN